LARVVLLLLILLGAAAYFPQTRPVVQEYIGPILNPVLTWQTNGEMARIKRELESLNRQGSDLPTPGPSFQAWMVRNFMGGAKTDAWGGNYTLTFWRDSLGIVSNGPDREVGTPDDLIQSFKIPTDSRRRRDD
jgi:hypothetical protein